jgi:hypothetical protein
MIIAIEEDGRVSLRDPDDFRRFEIEVASARLGSAAVAAALAPLGEVSDDGHAWIGEAQLMRLAGRQRDEEWLRHLAAMKDKARKFGWVDDGRCAIRAHIKWPPRLDTTA